MKKVYHHYISVTYQKNFADKDGKIWVLEEDDRIYKTNPLNKFKEGHYNTVNGSLDIEESLSELESEYSKIIKNKINNKEPINTTDKLWLSIYTSTIFNRIRLNREQFRGFLNDIAESSKNFSVNNSDSYLPPASSGKGVSIDEIKEGLENFNSHFANSSMNTSLYVANYLYNMHWKLLTAPKDKNFISSDNPAHICSPEREKKFGPNAIGARAGFGHKDIEFTLPLTSNIVLYANWDLLTNNDIKYIDITERQFDNIIKRTVRSAKTVFGNNKEYLEFIIKNTIKNN
ncbi:hypothetical protein C0583_05995 [Candidatus Parcubacteria bacterium]|nr:MAG: hypothetical protein C0583_05995 [Candidatus Parcubacteria bacterium]